MKNAIWTHISQNSVHLWIDVKFGMIVSDKANKNRFGFLIAYLAILWSTLLTYQFGQAVGQSALLVTSLNNYQVASKKIRKLKV